MNIIGLMYHVNGPGGIVWLVGMGIVPSLAGWLGDTHTGRYKVIRCSIWIMWIASVLATASLVAANIIDQYKIIDAYVTNVLLMIMVSALGGYQANIIQFGIDQLNDASTAEITSFIAWYVFTLISGSNVLDLVFACVNKHYIAIQPLFMCFCLSVVLILLFCCNHWLIKEPVKQNPFKLMYNVIKYTIKNKRPRCRSAFTYCEDDPPSRFDFAKSKYGGPFTTEQVEDVKTVLRLIPIITIGGSLAGGITATNFFRNKLYDLLTNFHTGKLFDLEYGDSTNNQLSKCYTEASYTHTAHYGVVVLIILNEVFLYPILHRCSPLIESFSKVLIGMLLQITRILILMVYEVTSRNYFITGKNATIQCLFIAAQGTLKESFDYRLIVIPDFLGSASLMMLYIGTVEFLSAQVPYSMKGLMVGMAYFIFFLSSIAWYVIFIPFNHDLSAWGTGTISCGFWYALLLLFLQISMFLITLVLKMRYKKRRREDLLPNEHFFAERYYSTNS